MRLAAIQGLLIDADGSTVFDWFAEFGITAATEIAFDLNHASPVDGALRIQCNKVVRAMARASQGARAAVHYYNTEEQVARFAAAVAALAWRRGATLQPAPGRRARANQSPKHPGEVRLVGEATSPRDLAQRLIRRHHHLLGTFDTSPADVSVECHAETDPEGAAEMAGAQPGNGRTLTRADGGRQCFVDMLGHLAHLPRCETSTGECSRGVVPFTLRPVVVCLQERGRPSDAVLCRRGIAGHRGRRAIEQFDDHIDQRYRLRLDEGYGIHRTRHDFSDGHRVLQQKSGSRA